MNMIRMTLKIVIAAVALFGNLNAMFAQDARIKIDPDRTIGEVDKMIYGNFVEHLGRCVYGGIWDPGSDLSDGDEVVIVPIMSGG